MIQDVNALLARAQTDLGTLNMRALLAEQERDEALAELTSARKDLAELAERVERLEAPKTPAFSHAP